MEIASYRADDLNDACRPLAALLGVWGGHGEVDYPTIEGPQAFAQQVIISHDGRPFLAHETRAWLLDADGNVVRPAAREVGWWRPQPDGGVEFLVAHATGIVEVFYGTPSGDDAWRMQTDSVVRTRTAKQVDAASRSYRVDEDGDLHYVERRAMMDQKLQPHTMAVLRRMGNDS